MNTHEIDAVAQTLIRARRNQQCVDAQPFANALTTHDDAYAVQAAVAEALDWPTSGPGYWKSGGPSRQAQLTHARLPIEGVWNSPAQAGSRHFSWRGIEPEIALRLGHAVDAAEAAELDHERAAALVDAMTVSIEVVDSRWQQYIDTPALLKLADLQAHGALVLGEWRPYEARDWSAQRCHVRIGAERFERSGTHALGDPAWGLVAWLKHATREGGRAEAGTVVTTGTWAGILPASAGDLVTVEFDGIGHASIQF
ncbi:2-keto-4-pentenoate hydratase [Paraburkholderia caffeinitolerans]|uniref:2-keto-4-pentenoate hydratase n=1 Tax=Paraburkholderia caffeinitolerans TaxID=1723730 RepID=A0A6J5FDE2_9BURK|nr:MULTISPECIES: fumarylacetoacetate hydrolase family protein [Paraburkholderia]CAB3777831.1 2-keto-4-pentenoate hydratase [Paraburkholderia caffeinitolerans]